jgi:4-amino-4-deoxy-L-arabinose transferase-like glycosyltransferase
VTGHINGKNTNNDQLRFLLLITLGAWSLRMFLALLAYGGRDIVGMLWPRGVEALGIARSLLSGNGFSSPFAIPTGPTAFLPPIYPAMLAGIERAFGIASKPSAWMILAMQCAFSALTCAAVYYLALRCFDPKIAQRAAWIWALFPYAVLLPTNIIWESSLSALLMITTLSVFAGTLESASVARWSVVGIAFALSCLVNAAFLLVLPALLLYLVPRSEYRQRIVYCFSAFLISLLPWTIRNYVTFGKVFPLRDNFGLELWIGNRDDATIGSDSTNHPAFNSSELREYQQIGEIAYMARKTKLATDYIRQKPTIFLKTTAERILTYWLVSLRALWFLIPVLAVLGFLGLFLLFRGAHPMAWIFCIPLLIYPLPYYLTHADLKYQHPVQPLLALLTAVAISRTKAVDKKPAISGN